MIRFSYFNSGKNEAAMKNNMIHIELGKTLQEFDSVNGHGYVDLPKGIAYSLIDYRELADCKSRCIQPRIRS